MGVPPPPPENKLTVYPGICWFQYATSINSLSLELIKNSVIWNVWGQIQIWNANLSQNISLLVARDCNVNFIERKLVRGLNMVKAPGVKFHPKRF